MMQGQSCTVPQCSPISSLGCRWNGVYCKVSITAFWLFLSAEETEEGFGRVIEFVDIILEATD